MIKNERIPLLARYILIALAVVVVLYLVWYFSSVFAYILVSAILAIMGRPVMNFISRIHIGK